MANTTKKKTSPKLQLVDVPPEVLEALQKGAPQPLRLCEKDSLGIVGTADPTRRMAPYTAASWELWGVSVATTYPDVTRLDVQFEMHPREYYERDPNVLKRLQACEVPLYMLEADPKIPHSVRYPIEAITGYRKYFTNSIAYMIALAYHSFVLTGKPKNVALYGVHMEGEEEYTEQRPCCEYWLGRLEGAGVTVTPAEAGSLLIANALYGYEKYNAVCWEMRQRTFLINNGIKQSAGEKEKWGLQQAKNEGALYECQYWLRKFQRGEFTGVGDAGEKAEAEKKAAAEKKTDEKPIL